MICPRCQTDVDALNPIAKVCLDCTIALAKLAKQDVSVDVKQRQSAPERE